MSDPTNPWAEQPDDFGDLDSFGGEYKPEPSFRVGIETLNDGPYDFEIVSAVMDRTKNTADRICRVGLKIVDTGRQVEWTQWLNKVESVNNFAANLAALNFDAHLWGTPQRPLSREIPAAVAKLPGVKFRAMKTSRPDGRPGINKVYHDLQINGRLDGRPMPSLPPPAQTPALPNGLRPTPAAAGAPGTGVSPSNDIPF